MAAQTTSSLSACDSVPTASLMLAGVDTSKTDCLRIRTLKNDAEQDDEKTPLLPLPTKSHPSSPPDPERNAPPPTPWYRYPRFHHLLGTTIYAFNLTAQLLLTTLFRLSYRASMDPSSPAWVYCVSVEYYLLFELLCVCGLQVVWWVDDAVNWGRGEGRLFSETGRFRVVLGVSCSTWVLAAGEVLLSCVGEDGCEVGGMDFLEVYGIGGLWGA